MDGLLPAPPVAPKKKMSLGAKIAIGLGIVIVLGAVGNASSSSNPTAPAASSPSQTWSGTPHHTDSNTSSDSTDTAPKLTPELLADVMFSKPGQKAKFCAAYAMVGNYDAALAAFADGYGHNKTPSAEAVFDELVGRC